MDLDPEKLCAIRVQLYEKTKYIIIEKANVGDKDIFIRSGEYYFHWTSNLTIIDNKFEFKKN